KQARLEIGYDLEGIFPDGFVGSLEREQMVPFFSSGKLGAGIEATVELLVARALESRDGQGPGQGAVRGHYSEGAGARTAIAIGSVAPEKTASPEAGRFTAQTEPLLALQKYLEALSLRIKDPELKIYTQESRRFFRQWLVTDAQQDREFRGLSRQLPVAEVRQSGARAVILFPIAERQAAPYFLQRGEEGWMLDFAGMSRWIAFNHQNQWHFKSFDHPYRFAFEHLTFDKHGFPHEKPQ
ncbi:MAG: TPM domain-containing protein, partial [Desulfuromonadaceae bacterium]|nr:TPM domain-containing protein [Desulfuromonadaceae bacterium]